MQQTYMPGAKWRDPADLMDPIQRYRHLEARKLLAERIEAERRAAVVAMYREYAAKRIAESDESK